ncbi:MAG: carbamoyl-phosphate synthase large subunit [Spirochaetaceae bacterium]|nr:carbamoyl-phosphate synthase large subunit [Spirochaetaceae bacterium]
MPKRTDIERILMLGAGPIVIGQACEFDYSGTQACKALRDDGYQVVLLNSNPATIMTDPEIADRTYVEPITLPVLEQILARERPDAVLTTLGGQTALNLAVSAAEAGLFERYGVEMLGADLATIQRAENREQFRSLMQSIGLAVPPAAIAHSLDEVEAHVRDMGLPVVLRPSYTLGGAGGGIAHTPEQLLDIATRGLELSLNTEVLVEQSVYGWKEFELELMRDRRDNVVVICSIENVDPMGVHTGDSITVAPAQTLTDREYQDMRDAAIKVIRAVGVETGGSNIQFAVNPADGKLVVIEMNPRLSRSSALASKATGFPIAKFAAKLAVGWTLDEIPNDITKQTPACFEPTIDYCVVKLPRFAFEKFPGVDATLTTQMQSVGEVLALGRTFKEAFQKGLRGLETDACGFWWQRDNGLPPEAVVAGLRRPNAERLFFMRAALERGMSVDEVAEHTCIDPWFVDNMAQILDLEGGFRAAVAARGPELDADAVRRAKRAGFSDRQLAEMTGFEERVMRARRLELGVRPSYKLVDTCAAEFEAYTPYFYSTYEMEDEVAVEPVDKAMIIGGGPNRIGQGIEFDYCCCQASFALRERGVQSIMVNCNPETVSTDYDTSDRLYFEPLTVEDVANIYDKERPVGVILQFGGQTPLNMAHGLEALGVKVLGTPIDAIDRAEDRARFRELLQRLGLRQPESGIAHTVDEVLAEARRIGYPVLVRPSYVLGGRAMEIVYDDAMVRAYMALYAEQMGGHDAQRPRPILVDKFLEEAIEIDVDLIGDGERFVVAGVMQHIEEAGVHSGDSACCLPPHSLPAAVVAEIRRQSVALGRELGIRGLMNIQFAVRADVIYVLEVNPRASRTVPFVSKAIGVPLARLATHIMCGARLEDLGLVQDPDPANFAVKEVVLPFGKFQGAEVALGPEMKSTGEVMGIDQSFGRAFAKAQAGAGASLPHSGTVFMSVRDADKPDLVELARTLDRLGFSLAATPGTADVLARAGLDARRLVKLEDEGTTAIDLMEAGEIALIINTPAGKRPRDHENRIRRFALARGVPCVTTMAGAHASVTGIAAERQGELQIWALQDL